LVLAHADRTFAAALSLWPSDDLPRIVEALRYMEGLYVQRRYNEELMKKAALDGRPF